MSRIDEALKRASLQTAGAALTELPPIDVASSVGSTSGASLDRYLVEQARAVRPPSRESLVGENLVVPVRRPAAAAPAVSASLRGKLVVSSEIEPHSIEQYRRLAAVLLELRVARGLKSLMVSSALAREGKTLTVTNLALTLSESYRQRVLLIDADFRRPSIHESFGIDNTGGLAEALNAPDKATPWVQVSDTLSVLPSGCVEGSPIAVLSSYRFQVLVAEACAQFDWVLLDTPPVALLTDAHLIARATDGVLFVIGAGATPYQLVQRSLAEIGTDRVVGTVLNRIDEHALPVGNHYHRQYNA